MRQWQGLPIRLVTLIGVTRNVGTNKSKNLNLVRSASKRINEGYIHIFVLCCMRNLSGWCCCCCYGRNDTNACLLRGLISWRHCGLSVFAPIHYQKERSQYLSSNGDRVRAYVPGSSTIWPDS